ncbi:B3 domain-containing protein REM23-like isoform X2 [Vicia villosa]|uniref:B3 domain-containing protein REM23-like isoform X2 n=1 Tax=Vicia villosa TaxID=3911 RepID=UPI00273AAD7B|nr:B3 domain-containing protein REM23-like isoform X2 [Vicia villosa]XP_058780411.1 B3 domain-containing protein REM23-like isoform X2 [Vicia villosa]
MVGTTISYAKAKKGCLTQRLPKIYVKKYWKGTSNPIFFRLPNGVQHKIFWEERDGDVWFQKNWKDFAKCLKYGDILTFKHTGGAYFKVKIFGRNSLEINYSNIKCLDEVVDLSDDESEERTQTQKRKNGKRKVADLNPSRNKGVIKKAKKCSNIGNIDDGRVNKEIPYFEVTLTPTYVNYYSMRIPNVFSRKYLKETEEIAILKVGEDMTMEVGFRFDANAKGMVFQNGWKNFSQKYNLQIGDICKFVMTQSKPLLFSIAITRAKMESKPKKFQGVSSGDDTIPKRKSIGESSRGRGRPKKHVSKDMV